jgi:hypothetical protein
MKRVVLVLLLLFAVRPAAAHIGSPDVFFEGDAGPYHLAVTVRVPPVIPGVATIEVRAREPVNAISVVPMRLTGPGSELPPAPDRATRSPDDPRFFTANLWLMEFGSLKVRITVDGPAGSATLAVPVAAAAQRTLGMDRGLGALLFVLMVLLALALVSIAGAAAREVTLEPGVPPPPARRARIATAIASVIVVGLLWLGHAWWRSEARAYERSVMKPWVMSVQRDGCTLRLPKIESALMPDHGHEMHLFVVRAPALDRLAHLHPTRGDDDAFTQQLPSLPAGRYKLFADVVFSGGFPVTATGEIEIPDLTCPALQGDDSMWDGTPSADIVFDPPQPLRARLPLELAFHVRGATSIEPYMGMAGHAAVIRRDFSVFAHLHPNGSVAMPALMLGGAPHEMYPPDHALPPDVSFPYGFPQPGAYRAFVQIKRDGKIETAAVDLTVP